MKNYFVSLIIIAFFSAQAIASESFDSKVQISSKDIPDMARMVRGDESLYVARKIQIELDKLGCKAQVNPMDMFYKTLPELLNFEIKSKTCRVQPKKGSPCPSGFAANTAPEVLGDGFKVCVTAEVPSTSTKQSPAKQ